MAQQRRTKDELRRPDNSQLNDMLKTRKANLLSEVRSITDINVLIRYAESSEGTLTVFQIDLLEKLVSQGEKLNLEEGEIGWVFQTPSCLELLLTSGDILNGDYKKALITLGCILGQDPAAREGLRMRLAIAVALTFAHPVPCQAVKNTFIDGVSRYQTFSTWADEGVFFNVFHEVNAWHLRYVVGSWHSNEELVWARENISPSHKNPQHVAEATFKMMTYRGVNDEGTPLKNKDEFYHFLPVTLENYHKYGGVCGAIARFGVAMAQAHGVPAMVVGQPGHAALAWYRDGSWALANKVRGWDNSRANRRTQYMWRKPAPFIQLMNDAQRILPYYQLSEKLRLIAGVCNPRMAFLAVFNAITICPYNYRAWEDLGTVLGDPDLDVNVVHEAMTPLLKNQLSDNQTPKIRNFSRDEDTQVEWCSGAHAHFPAHNMLNEAEQQWRCCDPEAEFVVRLDEPVIVTSLKIQWFNVCKSEEYTVFVEGVAGDGVSDSDRYQVVRTHRDEEVKGRQNTWSTLSGWSGPTRRIKFHLRNGKKDNRKGRFYFGIRKLEIWGRPVLPSRNIGVVIGGGESNLGVKLQEGEEGGNTILRLPHVTHLHSLEVVWKKTVCPTNSQLTVGINGSYGTVEVNRPTDNVSLVDHMATELVLPRGFENDVEALRVNGTPYKTKKILKMFIKSVFKEKLEEGCYAYLEKEFRELINSFSFSS